LGAGEAGDLSTATITLLAAGACRIVAARLLRARSAVGSDLTGHHALRRLADRAALLTHRARSALDDGTASITSSSARHVEISTRLRRATDRLRGIDTLARLPRSTTSLTGGARSAAGDETAASVTRGSAFDALLGTRLRLADVAAATAAVADVESTNRRLIASV
jgi:hypothetical protein